MRTLAFIIILISVPMELMAKAPECPLFENRTLCLASVEENYKQFLDFIEDEYGDPGADDMLQAAADIKHFETLACEKTCLN